MQLQHISELAHPFVAQLVGSSSTTSYSDYQYVMPRLSLSNPCTQKSSSNNLICMLQALACRDSSGSLIGIH